MNTRLNNSAQGIREGIFGKGAEGLAIDGPAAGESAPPDLDVEFAA